MLKLLVLAYSDDATKWVGKRARLYGDPNVKMKGVKVGGIRVSHLSHIDKPLTASLTITRGQSGLFTIDPLPDATPPPTTPPSPPPHRSTPAPTSPSWTACGRRPVLSGARRSRRARWT